MTFCQTCGCDPCINPGFCKSCRRADRAASRSNVVVLEAERRRRSRAAASTVEALMYSLRERGIKALAEADTLRRLSQLSDEQAIELGKRLRYLPPHIGHGPWEDDEIKQMFRALP
jgi:hypothetical protein